MSVLASQRTLSQHEYAMCFIKLYNHTEEKLSKMAKRKRRYLADPIITVMNDIFNDITQIDNDYFHYGIKLKSTPEQAKQVISKLLSLQKPLLSLWSIEGYTTDRMITWAELIDTEIRHMAHLGGLICRREKYMFILDYQRIRDMQFLGNMRELHKFIYSKVISLPAKYRDTNGMLLKQLADDAFYHLIEANRRVPANRQEYERRKEYIEIAFDDVNKMQIPTISLFLNMEYGEKVMLRWAELIDTELKLLNGLKASDKKRFKYN